MTESQSKVKELSACKMELELEVSEEEVRTEFDTALNQFLMRAKVKGFRQGKAPQDVVKQMYAPDIREAVLNALAPRAVGRELAAQNASPISTPVITDIVLEEGKPMQLKAEYEVWPEFKLPEYKKLTIKQSKTAVTDQEVDKSLGDLRERSAQYTPVEDRGIKTDDYVMAQVQGKDIRTKRLLPSEKVFVMSGHPENEPALNENLLGMKIGEEKHFMVNYPEEHKNKKVAGKGIDYLVNIISIKEKKLPELDNGFAKDMGRFENLKELKEEIRKQMKDSQEQIQKRELSEKVVNMVTEKVDIELPESLVQQETLVQLRSLIQSQRQQPTKQEDQSQWEAMAKQKAEKTVKNHLILMRIAEQEKLEISEEEITEEYKALAEANHVPLPQVVEAMNQDDRKTELKQNLLFRKTIDFLADNAIIE
jgi:trigger factor